MTAALLAQLAANAARKSGELRAALNVLSNEITRTYPDATDPESAAGRALLHSRYVADVLRLVDKHIAEVRGLTVSR